MTITQMFQFVFLVFFGSLFGVYWAWRISWWWRARKPRILATLGRLIPGYRPNPMSPDEYMWYLMSIGDLQAGVRETQRLMAATPADDDATHAALRERFAVLQERLARMEHAYKERLAAEQRPRPSAEASD